jgi:hypothetical protein
MPRKSRFLSSALRCRRQAEPRLPKPITPSSFVRCSLTGANDATVIVEGNASDLNAAVEGMRFTPVSTYRVTATISVALDDLGNSG